MGCRALARGLVVAALACLGLGLLAGSAHAQEGKTTVQGTQSSDRPNATTGTSTGSNTASFSGGTSARGGTGASASQSGDSTGKVSQSGSSTSGAPVAGSQVSGAAAPNVTVQNSNDARNPLATSGDARVTDTAAISLGPFARSVTGTARAGQIGDNSLDLSQAVTSTTGDAVAGSQVTGIVGDGEHVVQNQNNTTCNLRLCALSGRAVAANRAFVTVGPFARSRGNASVSQVGDDDAVLSEAAKASSGSALDGAQVTGVVGGSATVQNGNSSTGGRSQSGDADATNRVAGLFGLLVTGPEARSSNGTTQVTQTGDNSVDASQDVTAQSGDALSGAQVTGAVGDESGFLAVQNRQASEDDTATSGDAVVANDYGPSLNRINAARGRRAQASQIGDNDVTIGQTVNAGTGDALAGSQVTGDVGHQDVVVQMENTAVGRDGANAFTGNVSTRNLDGDGRAANDAVVLAGPGARARDNASASQTGNNSTTIDQAFTANTGDAVGGSQVTGVVASHPAHVVVQNSNFAFDPGAQSGDVLLGVGNRAAVLEGPLARSRNGSAQATQNGDNDLTSAQSIAAATGDAVGGSQVTGVVAGSDVTIQNQNQSELAEPLSSGDIFGNTGNEVLSDPGPVATSRTRSASVSQIGDNSLDADQSISAMTGDALAGAQVTGVVAADGSDVTIQNQNDSFLDTAFGGSVHLRDANLVNAETVSARGNTRAQASQVGDNDLRVLQDAILQTGDTVAGSQVTGVVTGDASTVKVQNSNLGTAPIAIGGDVVVRRSVNDAVLAAGPAARADRAQASQNGDNTADVSQDAILQSGDAVAGSQVTGVVAGAGSDVTVQNQNEATRGTSATSGRVLARNANFADTDLGPFADGRLGAFASQVGDDAAAVDQAVRAASGDAVAGSQVTGVVATGTVTTQVSNSADRPLATSGRTTVANTAVGTLGPSARSALRRASSQFNGDSDVALSQGLSSWTGDAVSGAQVNGNVGE